jgi:CarboxypepD_reg-like domain/TonB-dependent Receptor Plug Domain
MTKLNITLLILFFTSFVKGQNMVTYNGYVKDSLSGEALIGANIVANQNTGTTTNKFGFFSLKVPSSTNHLQISYLNYHTKSVGFDLKKTFLEVFLNPNNELETVVVKGQDTPIENKIAGLVDIPIERLKAVPMAMGETDIIKALAFTPGVSVGNEGTSGLLIRGGSTDQNMILLDDAPLYNQSQLKTV